MRGKIETIHTVQRTDISMFKKNNKLKFTLIVITLILLTVFAYMVVDGYKYFEKPTITLIGDSEVSLNVFEEYVDNGATAKVLNDKSVEIVTDLSKIDINKLGEYNVTYTAKNLKGLQETSISRKVKIVDTVSPVITLNGEQEITIEVSAEFTDPGANAIDNVDGDISKNIQITGNIKTDTVGKYTLTYEISDSSGNKSSITRIVNVVEKTQKPYIVTPTKKTIYLTFDDGPSSITPQILDVLKKHNVKATFFVIGSQIDARKDIVKRTSDEGHVVAIHTFSHVYSSIYASDSNYIQDLEMTRNKIKEVTGRDTQVFRFPGGASNTVSAKYSKGIMTRLATRLPKMGYAYFDWNMSSQDAVGKKYTGQEIFENLKSGLATKSNVLIPLMHDAEGKHSTVQGTDLFIDYCKKNGYNFDVLSQTTPRITQKVMN